MAKKQDTTHTKMRGESAGGSFRKQDLVPFLFVAAYFFVEWIPTLGAYDVMGSQWLFLLIVDMAAVFFIVWERKNTYSTDVAPFSRSLLSLWFGAWFLFAALTVLTAINPTETIVCMARLVATVGAFVVTGVLLRRRLHLFKYLAQLLAFALLVQAIQNLSIFFNPGEEKGLDQIILSLQGNAGNKNILAASFAVKIPFAFFCIYQFKSVLRILNMIILVLGTATLFIINARSSFIGLGFEMAVYLAFCFFYHRRRGEWLQAAYPASYVVVPVIVAFFIAQVVLSNAVELQQGSPGAYGNITERISTISLSGSSGRTDLWKNSLDYMRHHPLKGCGYGNWKIAVIHYETDGLLTSKHVHNDFMEMADETGLPGALLYLGLYICAFISTVKVFRSGKSDDTVRVISAFSLVALAGYFADASFNFPMERPVMQLFFAFILATNACCLLTIQSTAAAPVQKLVRVKAIFLFVSFALLIPAFLVAWSTYRSMVAQELISHDTNPDKPIYTSAQVDNMLPSIPNISETMVPIEAQRATYYVNENNYAPAIRLLNHGLIANPYSAYVYSWLTKIYFRENKMDSSYYYAGLSFYSKPGTQLFYTNLNGLAAVRGDTAALQKAFRLYSTYHPDAWAWNEYITRLRTTGYARQRLDILVDSARRLFPKDSTLAAIRTGYGPATVASNTPGTAAAPTTVAGQPAAKGENAIDYLNAARAAFGKGNLEEAIKDFTKVGELSPGSYYQSAENIGLCYYSLKQYETAIPYFDRVLQSKTLHDGKSEYFKGVCLLYLGKNVEGCELLHIADALHYPDAKKTIEGNCNGAPK